MEQPEGFIDEDHPDWVWELSMKQGGLVWNRTMNEAMLSWGFKRLKCNILCIPRSIREDRDKIICVN
jgi:hypothetical protein